MFGITKAHEINWTTTLFLFGTFLIAAVGTPLYLAHYGWSWFLFAFFLFMFSACAMSITLGYHRLFSHNAFKASWPVKIATLLFGAAAFENSVLMWASEHRRHHKHVDHDDDPYDISRGFWYAHMGWLFLRYTPEVPLDNVGDLRKDKLVMFQHTYIQRLAFLMGFIMPMAVGWFWNGWAGVLGCLIIVGFLRVVCVHHVTFFINSLCHTVGNQPYSAKCSAKDSWIMAIFTFGEGYHNYHHEFQHDYRNGVQRWQWDPTKWTIWLLHRLGLAENLRRVPNEKIMLAQIAEKERLLRVRMETKSETLSEASHRLLEAARAHLHHAAEAWETRRQEYARATEKKLEHSRQRLSELRSELRASTRELRASMRAWHRAYRQASLVPAAVAA
ncbi:MAG: fatty acid desaturase [Verrucomicrobium sp.]|nr:fatty acid desaturase [Verrucomicrobium sp.]